MTVIFRWLCLLLLPAGLLFSGESGKELFSKAEELFAATLYEEAILLYQEIEDPALDALVSCRLGQAHFYERQYDKALQFLGEADGRLLSSRDNEREDVFDSPLPSAPGTP